MCLTALAQAQPPAPRTPDHASNATLKAESQTPIPVQGQVQGQVPVQDQSQGQVQVQDLPLPRILAAQPPGLAERIATLTKRPQSPEDALALGILLALSQKYPEAEAALAAANGRASPLSGWAGLYLGLSRFKQNDFQGALAALEGVDPADPAVDSEATLLAAYSLDILGRPEALARYQRFLTFANHPMRPAALWRAGILAAQAGDSASAGQYARELMQAFPWTISAGRAEPAIRELHQSGRISFDPDSAENRIERIELLLTKGQNAKAQNEVARLEAMPEADPVRTLFLKGRALYAARQTKSAIQAFVDVVAKAQDPTLAAWALYYQARAYWRLPSPEDAARREELLTLALGKSQDIPDGAQLAAACRRLLALSRIERGRFAEALPMALKLAEIRGNAAKDNTGEATANNASRELAEAREQGMWLAGLIRFALADYRGAVRQFETFSAAFPGSDNVPAALYWTGRAKEAAGDTAGAKLALQDVLAKWPNGYYGMLATRRLAALPASRAVKSVPGTPASAPPTHGTNVSLGGPPPSDGPAMDQSSPCPPPGDPPVPEEAQPVFNRADLLEKGLLPELALHELTALLTQMPQNQAVALRLARLAATQGEHQAAVRALTRAFPSCLTRGSRNELAPLRDILYPSRFTDDIAQSLAGSSGSDVDIHLIQALIRQESFFEPDAVSVAGAVGLMQVPPSTARTQAEKYGDKGFDPATLKNPAVNIRFGVRYFLERYGEYDGNLALALASYNAGRVKVGVWREFLGGQGQDLFIEFIPYAETRDYVKRILGSQAMYALLYPWRARLP